MSEPLYNTAILRLAANIPNAERLPSPHASATRRSPVCGSVITVDVVVDDRGRIADIGLDVRACALGQASAALMSAKAKGSGAPMLARTRDELRAFLEGRAAHPGEWPGLEVFAPARPHSARHASILLAFEAATEAAERAIALLKQPECLVQSEDEAGY